MGEYGLLPTDDIMAMKGMKKVSVEIKCSMIGRDGYIETARVAIETAMCLLFDKLPFKGGVLTPTVACGEMLLKRMVAGNLKFRMGEWFPVEERCPPPWPQ